MIKLVCVLTAPRNPLVIGKIYEGRLHHTLNLNYWKYNEDKGEDIYDVWYYIPSVKRLYTLDILMPLAEWREQQINDILND